MRQLMPLDAAFLYGETPTSPMHICTVSHFAAGPRGRRLSLEAIRSQVQQRLHLLPPLRQRLVTVPFGIDHPYWIEDPHFDLDGHLHEVTLPPPGDRAQLAEQVARIAERPLDLDRPLWELHLILGLEGDQTALVTKYHHAAVDGGAAHEITAILLDPTPQPRAVPSALRPPRPEPVPSDGEMFMRGMFGAAFRPLGAMQVQQRMMRTMPGLTMARNATRQDADQVHQALHRDAGGRSPSASSFTAPRSPFNGSLTRHRSWASGRMPLDRVKALKNAFDATVNDVVMAVCASALRRWLLAHDALPGDPLLAMVPVSVRTEQERGVFGNRVSMMVPPLPTTLDDPVQRLRIMQATMRVAKAIHSGIGGNYLRDLSELAPPAMLAQAARMMDGLRLPDLARPQANVTITNVPGPSAPLYLAGNRMLTNYPVAFLPVGSGLSIAVLSYLDDLHFGVTACPELVPDVDNLLEYIFDALEELSGAVDQGLARAS